MSTIKELEVVSDNALVIQPEKYGLEKEKTNEIAVQFQPFLDKFQDVRIEFEEIMTIPDDQITEEIAAKARRIRLDTVKIRTGSDGVLKGVKEIFSEKVRIIDQNRRDIKEQLSSMEATLNEREKYFENLEKERLEGIQNERMEILKEYEVDGLYMDLSGMPEDVWENYLSGVKLNYEAKKEEERKAEEERLERERIENLNKERKEVLYKLWMFVPEDKKGLNFGELEEKEYNKLVGDAESAKIAYVKEQEELKKKADKLKAEQEAKSLLLQKRHGELSEYMNYGDPVDIITLADLSEKEWQSILKSKKDAYDTHVKEQAKLKKLADEKAEKERKANLKAKKEAEALKAKLKAKEEEEARKLKEREDKKAAEAKALKQKELAPDKDKLIQFGESLLGLELPNVNSDEAKKVVSGIEELLGKVNTYIIVKCQSL